MQAAWVLVVPPFRGLDEHDHAYKAAAVARGTGRPHHEEGTDAARVPGRAARPRGGRPTRSASPSQYTALTTAGPRARRATGWSGCPAARRRYNPVSYFLIGTAARAFDGTAALYAMRAVSALASAVLIALAAVALRRWARTPWPAVAFLLTATPTMLYTTSVAAPNGVEVAGAMLVWSALLGLVASDKTVRGSWRWRPSERVPLVGSEPRTPLAAPHRGRDRRCWGSCRRRATCEEPRRPGLHRRRCDRHRRSRGAGPWPRHERLRRARPELTPYPSVWSALPNEILLWVLQNIGAFPSRDNAAPPSSTPWSWVPGWR